MKTLSIHTPLPRLSRLLRDCLIAFILSVGDDLAQASTETWTGNDDNDAFWTSNNNWSGIGGAGPDDDLIFPENANRKTNTNDFSLNTNFNSLKFTGHDYDINGTSGNGISIFLASGITVDLPFQPVPGADPIFRPNIFLGANQTWTTTPDGTTPNGMLQLNGVVNLNNHNLIINGNGEGFILNGLINGTGTITKSGNCTLTITNTASGFGTTTLTAGELHLTGTLGALTLQGGTLTGTGTVNAITATGGTIDPGEIGADTTARLTSNGAVVLDSATTLRIDLAGSTAGTNQDQFLVSGNNINLNSANLSVHTVTPFVPADNQQFIIVSQTGAGSISGQFAQGDGVIAEGKVFAITYTASSVTLTKKPRLIWDGGASSNNWSQSSNWNPNAVPADGLFVEFPANAPADSLSTVNDLIGLQGGFDVGGFLFTGGGYSIGGGNIDLGSGGITVTATSGGPITLACNITLNGSASFLNDGPPVTLTEKLDLQSFMLTVDGTGNQTIEAVFGSPALGADAITKNGTGTLRLSGQQNSNYTGRTIVNAGVLEIISADALGDTSGTLNNTFVNPGATLRLLGAVNVPSPLQEQIILNGDGVGGQGALTESGCDVTAIDGCLITGSVSLAGNTTIAVPNADHKITLAGSLGGGAQTLTKIGPGILVLSGNNSSYTGTTTVNAGTLLVNGNNSNTPVFVANGATLGGRRP